MKIKMIGTGALTGESRSSTILIDNHLLCDCGNGIVKTMLEQKINIEDISNLFITHMHADHFFDIPFLILYRNIKGITNELNVYVPVGGKTTLNKLFEIAYPDIKNWDFIIEKTNVKINEYLKETEYNIEAEYNVKVIEVVHGDYKGAYGFLIKTEKDSLFISGDSSYCQQVETMISEANCSVLDISFIKSKPSHMGVNDLENIVKNHFDKIIIPTHMTPEAKEEIIKMNKRNIIVPNDGMKIEL